MSEQPPRYCNARIPNACRLFATTDDSQHGPVCEGCYRSMHPAPRPVARGRNYGNRGVPQRVRQRILDRDGHRCQLRYEGCVGQATEVDHTVNVARLGVDRAQANDPGNLAAACGPCHRIKTERERVTALAASNRQRAAARRARLGRPAEKHPGDD